ncbi:hypothetical protein Bhyg_14732, partial [Pseudolycoriella hygida]
MEKKVKFAMDGLAVEHYLPIPDWLNQQFLEKSIRKHSKRDTIFIQSFSIVPATAKGENFASAMFRVKVSYHFGDEEKRNESFIIKTESDDGVLLLNDLNVYEKELEMYEQILPKLRRLLDNAGHNGELFAATMYVSFSKKAIVFEDLAQKAYKIPSSKSGMDMIHTKVFLKKLAKFHATCAVLEEQQPGVFKNFQNGKETNDPHQTQSSNGKINLNKQTVGTLLWSDITGMLNRSTTTFHQMYLNMLSTIISVISTWKDYDYYVDKLTKLRGNLIEKGRRAYDPKPHHFNTLIHGDMWVNNTMYTYNANNEPEKMMLVDFQYCCWTSPTIDLHYFMNTSLRNELRLNHQEELLQIYHSELARMLASLQYKKHIPSLHELYIQFIENNFYAFVSSMLIQPLQINENCEDADLFAIFGNGEKPERKITNLIKKN